MLRLSKEPMVSVIMPVYNAQQYLREAIDSILNQTFGDFEFIIFDDGSTDESLKIIQSYRDSRIRVVSGKGNRKLVPPLNDAIQMAKGKYLARMDSDDISLANRFQEQVTFMEKNPNIDVCGTFFRTIGGRVNLSKAYPVLDPKIKLAMLFYCPLAHPTVMMRRSTMINKCFFYDEQFLYAEDYDLWSRMAASGCTFHNIPEVLLRYRVGHLHIFSEHGGRQQQLTHQILARNLVDFGLPAKEVQPLLHDTYTLEHLKEAVRVFDMLPMTNSRKKQYDPASFGRMVSLAKIRFVSEQLRLGIGVFSCISIQDVFRQPIAFLKFMAKFIVSCTR